MLSITVIVIVVAAVSGAAGEGTTFTVSLPPVARPE